MPSLDEPKMNETPNTEQQVVHMTQEPSQEEYERKLQKVRTECRERLNNPEILAVYQRLADK